MKETRFSRSHTSETNFPFPFFPNCANVDAPSMNIILHMKLQSVLCFRSLSRFSIKASFITILEHVCEGFVCILRLCTYVLES